MKNNEREKDYWACPLCGTMNVRDFEGLDKCEKCGAETRTRFNLLLPRMTVTMAREPTPPQLEKGKAPLD